ncbi:hypothetical protein [Pikeienuella sp. HZG-20]|uniref:hypothetical protein n=1 Tax=Paludibacillus litoralis TaxID=3133267 RepID=UPI0030ECEF2F
MTSMLSGARRPALALGALLSLLVPPTAAAVAQEVAPGASEPGALARAEAETAREARAPVYPRLTGGVAIELQNDYTFDSDDPTGEINDLYNTTEAALALEISAETSLNATLVFEPIRDPGPNDDRVFEDQGLYAEELYLRHDFGFLTALAGKYDPAFGAAWDAAPGLYGADFAEDYELTERLGAAFEAPFALAGGEAVFSVAVFAADRTFLSGSLVHDRGELNKSDGGVSNTSAPESVVVSLAGETEGVDYTIAFRRQAKGVGDAADEYGLVAGVQAPLGEMGVDLLSEVAVFPDFDGTRDRAIYATLGLAAPLGPVTVSGVYSLRKIEHAPTDHLATVSAEYEIADGVSIGAGYRYGREGGDDNHTVGALFVYEFGF